MPTEGNLAVGHSHTYRHRINAMPLKGDRKREYQRNWVQARREAWIASQGGKCVLCGSSESIEIDHIDPKLKQVRIATLWSRDQAFRDAELAKCQLLCHDCHKEKTYPNLGQYEHGTTSGYWNYKCRCVECSAAQREYDKQRKHRRSQTLSTA